MEDNILFLTMILILGPWWLERKRMERKLRGNGESERHSATPLAARLDDEHEEDERMRGRASRWTMAQDDDMDGQEDEWGMGGRDEWGDFTSSHRPSTRSFTLSDSVQANWVSGITVIGVAGEGEGEGANKKDGQETWSYSSPLLPYP